MPVPMKSIEMFISSRGDISKDILEKAKRVADSEGMVAWGKVTNLLGEEIARLFQKDLSQNGKHQEILSATYRVYIKSKQKEISLT